MDPLLQQALGAADLGRARKERQHRAGFCAQRTRHGVGDLRFDARARIAAEIARLDRIGAALALDDGRTPKECRDARTVDGRGHDQDLQVLAQALLRVARKCEAEIGVERALVEFVEQHRGDALQFRIVEDQPREHALGDDLDPGLGRYLRAEAHAQAHRLTGAFAECLRHPVGGGARRDPARLEHEDLARRPRLALKHQRHARGLAGTRRRDQHRDVAHAQRGGQRRQRIVDGKRRVEVHPLRHRRACPGDPVEEGNVVRSIGITGSRAFGAAR